MRLKEMLQETARASPGWENMIELASLQMLTIEHNAFGVSQVSRGVWDGRYDGGSLSLKERCV